MVLGRRIVRRILNGRPLWPAPAIVLPSSLVLAASDASAGIAIWHNRPSALAEHQRDINSVALILAEQTARYTQVIDLIVDAAWVRIGNFNAIATADFHHKLETESAHSYLAECANDVPQANSIVLIDADDLMANWPWELVLAVVDVQYLIAAYRAAGEHLSQAVTLLHPDGTMLIRSPTVEPATSVRLPQRSPWYVQVDAGGNTYVVPGILDGRRRLVSAIRCATIPLSSTP